MRVAQVGAFVTTIASLSSFTYGYTFSESNEAIKAESVTTKSLTENQKSSIYGGKAADIGKYPFIASLSDSLSGSTFCAGTLITPQFILTAGHCITLGILPTVATFESNLSSVGEAKVREQRGLDYKIVAGFRHPLYNKTAHLYDVGLLKLEKPVKRPTAKLCAADGSDNPVGTMATAIGWGKTSENNLTMNPYLEEITLPIIANAECNKFKRYVGRITEGMLCAGVGDGRDTCNGDSGGPLIVNGDTLIGFVSWGSKCGEQAGVFTRLTYVMDYIEGILDGGKGSEYGEVKPGSEMMQSIADAMATGSGISQGPAATSTPMESGSGSFDMGAMLTELLNAGSSPSDLQKMFSSMGMQLSGSDVDSGSEDTEPENEPEDEKDEEGSFEANSKKADSDSKTAVSEDGSESADDEQEAVKSDSEEVMQSVSDAGTADSQDVTETMDASGSGSEDIAAMIETLLGGGSDPSDLLKMFGTTGSYLPESEDAEPEKDPKDREDAEDSSEANSKKADSDSKTAVSEDGSESADDEQEAVKSGRHDSLTYLDSGTDEELLVMPRKSSKTMESVDEASALDEEETAEQTEKAGKVDHQGGDKGSLLQ